MRSLLAAGLFAASVCAALVGPTAGRQPGQDKKADAKKAQQKFDPPKATKPDDATLKQIAEKTEQLRKAIDAIRPPLPYQIAADVLVYLKAAEWIVRHDEWFLADSGRHTLRVLDAGLERAAAAAQGKYPWLEVRGKPVARGFFSQIDGSVQPYAVTLPAEYGKDKDKQYRLDLVLHGRDASLTEVKFINARETAKAGAGPGHVVLDVYGRGNNAYRWAGEHDVFDAWVSFDLQEKYIGRPGSDVRRVMLRGFSMGGAGTWHLGLHHPDRFCVIGPGAGFTTTHGYVGSLPDRLPEYQEKCLHVYDAVDYAENAFNVPVVAYSGEKDAQKKAADNIAAVLSRFKEPVRFTHLVAPGLEHQMPAEWQAKAEAEYRKYADPGRPEFPERVRFVTYTTAYGKCDWVEVLGLDRHYEKSVVDARRTKDGVTVVTQNVRVLRLTFPWVKKAGGPVAVEIDGAKFGAAGDAQPGTDFEKRDGKWAVVKNYSARIKTKPEKSPGLQGPLDDAFSNRFLVIPPAPTRVPLHKGPANYVAAEEKRFAAEWGRYFRGTFPVLDFGALNPKQHDLHHLVLFGDPNSNPVLAAVLPKLPITWTKDELVVDGVRYDAATHVPVLIYPNPLNDNGTYVVVNSGHTFREADLKGTNALLYPRLGDWAVVKPTPTDKDPAAYEVVAAGLFDENWQFKK